MSRKRRDAYEGCTTSSLRGKLRLRFRLATADGREKQHAFPTGLEDTHQNRETLKPLRKVVGALVKAGKDPRPYLEECLARADGAPSAVVSSVTIAGETVEGYFRTWFPEQVARPSTRPAQRRDYRRHIEGYVLPGLGEMPLAGLRPKDVRGLQADLLGRTSSKTGRPLSEKFVKNIICGSFQAMVRQARIDGLVLCDPFEGLEWDRYEPPDADPFQPEERDAILDWFKAKRFGVHAGRPSTVNRLVPHPPFHGYLHFLFWTGARPSEASGLRWRHVDLRRGLAHVRESYHMGRYGKPKTQRARRTIELHPDTVPLLRVLQPEHVAPDMPVFVNTEGNPIEPKAFSERWYDCLRALGLRQRGLYATKDTFVTLALATRREDVMLWLVQQTGVAYETLRRHYAKFLPKPDRGMWRQLDPALARERRPAVAVAS
jgi:integrase